MDNSQVNEKAQEILDEFLQEMQDITINPTYNVTRKISLRDEGEGEIASEEFREQFLNNAPNNGDAILANKGAWVEK